MDLTPPDATAAAVAAGPAAGGGAVARLAPGPDGLDRDTRCDLRRREKEIARQFHSSSWAYGVFAVCGFAVWLSFFPLAIAGLLNLPLAFVAATALIIAVYLAGHEAMHGNIGRRGEKLYWLNELAGFVSTIPIALSFGAARITHLEHHRHCNDPLKDPDFSDQAPGPLAAWYKTWYNRQPGVDGSVHHYKRVLKNLGTPEATRALYGTLVLQIVFLATLFTMAWTGHAIAAALIWWLPRHLALSWIRFYFSWAPHHPRQGRSGRYDNSRIFRSRLGRVLTFETETHLVHHLYPNIPNHRTRAAYFALKPILAARGVDVSPL
ncbi:MAG: fatty acid desaturase [Novosphingobium sp.]